MMIDEVTDLLRGTFAEWRRDPVMATIGLVPLIALGMWGDLGGEAVLRLSFLAISITSFILQYALTRRALRAGGLLAADATGNVGGFFGLCFLSNVGVLIGFVLFVVPGIWLYVRWIAAGPILFAEETTVSDALGRSAARTQPLLWAFLFAVGILYLPFLVGFTTSILAPDMAILSVGASLLINFGVTISQVASWYLAIAVYRALQPEPIEAVFA